MVNERLKALAKGLNKFGKDETKDNGREKGLKNHNEKERNNHGLSDHRKRCGRDNSSRKYPQK
jgi:hypothetical protein